MHLSSYVQGRHQEWYVTVSIYEAELMNLSSPCFDSEDICLPPQQIGVAKKSSSLLSTLPSLMCFKMVSADLSDCPFILRLWDLVNNNSESTLSTAFMIL